jgi:hypothetical protein
MSSQINNSFAVAFRAHAAFQNEGWSSLEATAKAYICLKRCEE